MPKPWSEVENSKEFQNLETSDKLRAKTEYFETVVSPKVVDSNDVDAARLEFFTTTDKSRNESLLPEDIKPQNRFIGALKESISAIPAVAAVTQPRNYADAFMHGLENPARELMGVPKNQEGFLSEALKFNPLGPAESGGQISEQLSQPEQRKNFAKATAAEGVGLVTSPLNYAIPVAIEASKLIPVGKATIGKILEIPANRIRDAISGKLEPEVIDRFMRKIETLKKLKKHLPESVKNQSITRPEPASSSEVIQDQPIPLSAPNEVTNKPVINIPGNEAVGTGETKVRGLSQSIQERSGQESLGELPTYNVLQDKAQRQIFNDAMSQDPDRVHRVAMGQELAPQGSTSSAFLKYLEEKSLKDGDIETLKKLAKESDVLKQATEAGQFVSSLRDMNPESPVKAVDDILSARKAAMKRQRILKPEQDAADGASETLGPTVAAFKKRLLKQIKNLKSQIESGQRAVRQKHPMPNIPALNELVAERNKLKQEFFEIFGKRKMSETERLKALKIRTSSRIKELESKLKNRDFSSNQKTPIQMDLEAKLLIAKRDEAKLAYEAAKSAGPSVSDAEVSKIVQLSQDVANKKSAIDHASPKGSPTRMEYGRALHDFNSFVNDLKLKTKSLTLQDFKNHPYRTIGKKALDLLGADKYLSATGDFSALLLQGGKLLANEPKIWLKNASSSFGDFFKTLGGKVADREVMADILSRPNSLNGNYKKYGLHGAVLEESFPVPFVERIPKIGRLFKGFENAFTGFIRRGRADVFDKWYDKLDAKGADKEGLGILANSFMGRGMLPFGLERAAGPFNKLFFAPRAFMSDVDFLLGHLNTSKMNGAVRSIAFKNLATSVLADALILGTAYVISPKSVEWDPRSSDFGSVKRGNTSYGTPFAGRIASVITLLSRLVTRSYKSAATGKITQLNTEKYGSKTVGDVISDYFQNRYAPMASVLNDRFLRGRDFKGDKPTLGDNIETLTVPFPIRTFTELMKDPDVVNQVVGNLYATLGGRVNSYERNKQNNPIASKIRNRLKQSLRPRRERP